MLVKRFFGNGIKWRVDWIFRVRINVQTSVSLHLTAGLCTCYQPLSLPAAILILLTTVCGTDWRCLQAGIDILHSFWQILYCMLSMSDVSGLLSMHRSKVNLVLNLLPCMIYLRNTCVFRSLIAYAVGCLKKMQVSQNTRKVVSLCFV